VAHAHGLSAGPRAEPERVGYWVVHLHPADQRQHVVPFLVGDGNPVLGERSDNLLQCQAVLAHLDEVMQHLGLLSAQLVLQRDQQGIQLPGQVFVIGSVQAASLRVGRGDPGQLGSVSWPMRGCQRGGDLPSLAAADFGQVVHAAAVGFLDEHRGVLPPQLPGHLLPGIWKMPDAGVIVVAVVPLADHGNRLPAMGSRAA
jgi:hypothetical protein